MIRRGLIFPLIVLVLTLVGAVILIVWGKELSTNLGNDVFPLLAQFVLISGIGSLITLAISEFTRSRDRRQQEREVVRKALSDLVNAYNEVKRVRRLLRAKATRIRTEDNECVIDRDAYDLYLQRLNDAQLQLEFYARYAEGNNDIFGTSTPQLVELLGQAEKYLGKVITEWEHKLATFSGDPSEKLLSDLPELKRLTDSADKGFGSSVAQPICKALITLSTIIVA